MAEAGAVDRKEATITKEADRMERRREACMVTISGRRRDSDLAREERVLFASSAGLGSRMPEPSSGNREELPSIAVRFATRPTAHPGARGQGIRIQKAGVTRQTAKSQEIGDRR